MKRIQNIFWNRFDIKLSVQDFNRYMNPIFIFFESKLLLYSTYQILLYFTQFQYKKFRIIFSIFSKGVRAKIEVFGRLDNLFLKYRLESCLLGIFRVQFFCRYPRNKSFNNQINQIIGSVKLRNKKCEHADFLTNVLVFFKISQNRFEKKGFHNKFLTIFQKYFPNR